MFPAAMLSPVGVPERPGLWGLIRHHRAPRGHEEAWPWPKEPGKTATWCT